MKVIRFFMTLGGILLIADTIFAMTRSNMNLGIVMPAILGLPLLILGIFWPRLKRGIWAVLKWTAVSGLALALVLFIVCGCLMLSAINKEEKVEADALIVLGAGIHGDQLSWILTKRLNTALHYLENHPDCVVVVTGGQGPGETVTEASVMAKYLISRGIAPERIVLEEEATNTLENFAFSKTLIDERFAGEARMAFVTTGFHVYRAGRVARAQGLAAQGLAAPDASYVALNNFMRESVGIVVYALLGRI
ncbi:MAG: YdcF family protein [Clostridiales bacterium]|nr:YdcF family protein [Clostridiales bacterium]